MSLSEFLTAYLSNGNLLLAEAEKNLAGYMGMFSGLTAFPTVTPMPEPVKDNPDDATADPTKDADAPKEATKKLTPGSFLKQTDDGSMATTFAKGNIAYRGSGANAPYFNFKKDPPETVSFTPAEWTELEQMFNKGEVPEGAGSSETMNDDDKTKVLDAKERKKAAEASAEVAAVEAEKALTKVGFSQRGLGTSIRTLFRQIFGFGGDNAIRKSARERELAANPLGGAQGPLSPEQAAQQQADEAENAAADAQIILSVTNRVASIVAKVKNGGVGLNESDRKFMRECLRLRGTGKEQGIYLVPSDKSGDTCGGELAANAIPHQQGGDRYGVKIGNQNSPLFDATEYLYKQSLKKMVEGNPLASEDGKPAIFWSSNDAARMNSYRAMDGVLNEYGPQIAQAWIGCGRAMPCSGLATLVEEMVGKEQFNLNLLIFGAEQRNSGEIPEELQFADVDSDGNEQILNDIAAQLGEENVNGNSALAWYVGSLVNSWDAVVSDPAFAGCEFTVVGRGPTGQQKNGTRVAQDVQVTCPHLAEDVMVNSKNHVKSGTGSFGSEEDKNRSHYTGDDATGINIKTTSDGNTVAYGKSSANVIDAVERDDEGNITGFRPDTESARNRAANNIQGMAENHGETVTEKDKEDADNYKLEEIRTIDRAMGSIGPGGLQPGTVQTVMADVRRQVGFEEGEHFGELEAQFEELQNTEPGSKEYKKAEARIRATLTNAYRKKNQDKPGFRLNMAIEYSQTGQSTQNDAFVMTEPAGGATYVGAESDAAGGAVASIMGYGREGGPAPIVSVNGTGVTWEGGITLNRRVKDGSLVQEALEDTRSVKKRLRKLETTKKEDGVENSSMKAEDFVRQLQELIKRIDKVQTIKN